MLGLTGVYAAVAEPQKKALDLYAEQLKKQGGINGHPVEFTFVDTGGDESQAVNSLRKLVTQDRVIGIVGPSSSGEGIAIKPIVESLKVPTIAIAASDAIIAQPASYMFKEFPASLDSLRAQLAYLKDKSLTKVGLLYSNNAYGQEPAKALPDLAKEYGLTVTASEAFPPAATDTTPQLSAVAKSNPDVVLVWAVNPANAVGAKNAKAIGLKAQLFQAPGAASTAYIDLGGPAVEDTLVQASKIIVPDAIEKSDPQYQVIRDFAEAYQQKYGSAPSQFGAGGWDAMLLMVSALEKANIADPSNVQKARDQVRDALEGLRGVPGAIAVYNLSKNQHGPTGIKGQAVLRVKGGKFTLEHAA
jgi:branched-chain amino acid transport system substrate-binding protein